MALITAICTQKKKKNEMAVFYIFSNFSEDLKVKLKIFYICISLYKKCICYLLYDNYIIYYINYNFHI